MMMQFWSRYLLVLLAPYFFCLVGLFAEPKPFELSEVMASWNKQKPTVKQVALEKIGEGRHQQFVQKVCLIMRNDVNPDLRQQSALVLAAYSMSTESVDCLRDAYSQEKEGYVRYAIVVSLFQINAIKPDKHTLKLFRQEQDQDIRDLIRRVLATENIDLDGDK